MKVRRNCLSHAFILKCSSSIILIEWIFVVFIMSKLFKSLIPQDLKINHASTSIVVIIHQQATNIAPQRMSMTQFLLLMRSAAMMAEIQIQNLTQSL